MWGLSGKVKGMELGGVLSVSGTVWDILVVYGVSLREEGRVDSSCQPSVTQR